MNWKHVRETKTSKCIDFAGRLCSAAVLLLVRLSVIPILLWLSWEFAVHAALRFDIEGVPSVEELRSYRPMRTTVLYDRYGKPFARFFIEDRVELPLSDMSPWIPKAVVAAEDARFPSHRGVSLAAIARAAIENRRAGTIRQGGSTITQQLARNMFLSRERTIERKVREAVIAFRLESEFSKEEILEKYLNEIYFGRGAWGVETASQVYFGKHARDLSLGEAALLAGVIPSPNRTNPGASPDAAEAGKRRVLARMFETGAISARERSEAEAPVTLVPEPRNPPSEHVRYPYYAMRVLNDTLLPEFGVNGAYGGGLRVYTMLDPDLQEAGERIAARSKHQLAIVGLDSETGGVRALVGGKDWHESQFDRAVQAYRQPGSAFKPLVYATLFEKKGWSGATTIQDAPISFGSGRNRWSPRNYDGKFRGSVTVERAIISSLNVPAVRALSAAGAKVVAETVRSMGITTPYLPDNPTMALGSASLTPLEMAAAFSVFGNGGYRIVPTLVREIRDADGKVLFKAAEEKKRVLSEYTANGIRDILIKAVSSGTGRAARIDGFQVFGKTGTTNDFRDAWFVGGIPGFCAAVYVGDDDRKPLGKGATGGKIAAPIWQDFMEYAADRLCAPAAFPKNTEKTPPVPRERGAQEKTDFVEESETASQAPPKEPVQAAPPPAEEKRPRIVQPALPPAARAAPDAMLIETETEKKMRELLQKYNIE